MAEAKDTAGNSLWRELSRPDIYKRTQGRWTRQITAVALATGAAVAAWQLYSLLLETQLRLWLPLAVVVIGIWLAYRIVNIPRFADFLISVEAEMAKVTWPSRQELWRGSMVVIVLMLAFAAVLVFYDLLWQVILDKIGVTHFHK